MLLSPRDLQQFFRLHRTLMHFVNQRLQVTPEKLATPEEFSWVSPEMRLKVRDGWLANLELLDAFADENLAQLSQDDLAIIHSWRHFIAGRFFVFRELKKYTVFLTTTGPNIAYGVLPLTQTFGELIRVPLPVVVQTVLLPFKDKIVYDGLMTAPSVSFGPGTRRSLNESYKEAKQHYGIITSLPMPQEPLPGKARKAKPTPKAPSKEAKQEVFREIIAMVDRFCHEHLNEEYAALCRRMAEKLAGKRPSPLLQGRPNAWAAGIVRAVGSVNFLHDKTQTPFMRATDIDRHLGTSPTSGAAKAAAIRKMLKLYQLDPNWTLPSRLDDNPMVWMLEVNGFIMDVREMAREVQEAAFIKGLIPYIPADRRQ